MKVSGGLRRSKIPNGPATTEAMPLLFPPVKKHNQPMPRTVKFLLNFIFSVLLAIPSFAQIISPPQWDIQFSNKSPKVGEEVELVFKAKIPVNWYIYSNDFDPDLGPLLTELNLEDSVGVERAGELKAVNPKTKYEDIWEGDVTYFENEGEFRQRFKVTETSGKA